MDYFNTLSTLKLSYINRITPFDCNRFYPFRPKAFTWGCSFLWSIVYLNWRPHILLSLWAFQWFNAMYGFVREMRHAESKLSHRDETTSFIYDENIMASDSRGTGQNVLNEVGQPALAHHSLHTEPQGHHLYIYRIISAKSQLVQF